MVVTDAQGIPLAATLRDANKAEVRLATEVIDCIRVPTRTKPKRRARKVVADRAYDSRQFRVAVLQRSMQPRIPGRRNPKTGTLPAARRELWRDYGKRWPVERTIGWLGDFRRLVVRWERLITTYQGFFHLGLVLICLRRLG